MTRIIAVAGLMAMAGATALAAPLSAQVGEQEEQTARYVVTRNFQCTPQGGGVAWLQTWRPVVQEMIDEGRFIDYGVLTHSWGDEWNVNDYFVVGDMGEFFDSFAELVRRIGQADLPAPTVENAEGERVERRPFGQICTAHKDNIYGIVQPSGV